MYKLDKNQAYLQKQESFTAFPL